MFRSIPYSHVSIMAVLSAFGVYGFSPANADPVADFYRGKQMTMLISTPPGSGYDTYARLLQRNLGRYIPGKPRIIPTNMPGAGGMKLLNHAYNQAPRDGTVIFTLHFNLPLYQAMGGRGVMYDAGKLIGLGRLLSSNAVIGVWSESKSRVRNLQDARERAVVIGSTGATSNSTVYPTILNNLVGTKFKVVPGYRGSGPVFLAMERGEIDGFGSYSYLTFKSVKPEYLTQKRFHPIVQWGPKREEAWPDVPTAIDVAATAMDKKSMEIASSGPEIGFSYFMPPDVPGERVRALRAAFATMIEDRQFLDEVEKSKLALRPASGEEIERIVANVLNAPTEAVERLRKLMVAKGRGARCEDYTDQAFCRAPKKRK